MVFFQFFYFCRAVCSWFGDRDFCLVFWGCVRQFSIIFKSIYCSPIGKTWQKMAARRALYLRGRTTYEAGLGVITTLVISAFQWYLFHFFRTDGCDFRGGVPSGRIFALICASIDRWRARALRSTVAYSGDTCVRGCFPIITVPVALCRARLGGFHGLLMLGEHCTTLQRWEHLICFCLQLWH